MIQYNSITISNILSDSDSTPLRLVVPNFQREFVWERDSQKNLLASFLIGIPIGSLLIIKGSNNEFSAKRLCLKDTIVDNALLAQECNYLLDGQQRISTIKGILTNPFSNVEYQNEISSIYENLYAKLRTRWLLRIKPNENEEDLWGFNSLYFDSQLLIQKEPSDIMPFIEYKMDIKNSDRFYSPVFELNLKTDSPTEWLNSLASMFAQNSLLPFWEFSTKTQLFESVIDKIADAARQKIVDDYNASNDKRIFINKLKSVNLNAKTKDFNNPSTIDTIWSDLRGEWKSKVKDYLTAIVLNQNLSVIDLPKDEIARATIIFENLNRGGTPLSTFDLIVAKSYNSTNQQSLRELIRDELKSNLDLMIAGERVIWNGELIGAIEDKNEDLHKETKEQFLNLLSIIVNSSDEVNSLKVDHIKKHSILSLDLTSINSYNKVSIENLKRALLFFNLRLGVKHINDIVYKLMILPISLVLYKLGDNWADQIVWNKLEYWYWLSLFSGRYRDKQNERCIEDIKELYDWIIENDQNSISRFNLTSQRFSSVLNNENYSSLDVLTLQNQDYKPPTAIINALLQYELSKRPQDLYVPNVPYNQLDHLDLEFVNRKINCMDISKDKYDIEVHHIIPLSTTTSIGQSSKQIRSDKNNILNSPLNLTFITKDANRKISNYAPKVYINAITENLNNLPIHDHHIPNDMTLFNFLNNEEGRLNFLKRRYQLLKMSIETRLRELFNS
jgi:hypothetical protein